MRKLFQIGTGLILILAAGFSGLACTNLLVTKGASKDGSVMITYLADSHTIYGVLTYTPAARYAPGTMRDVYDSDSGKYLGQIKQAGETYSVVGNMNEFQVAIGETTFGGRRELTGYEGGVDYGSLMSIALERSKTAREAIKVIADLTKEYGYYSSGESFSIADKNEVWIMEMVGKGKDVKGALWVARRVPDGYICAHANKPRITQFPLNDPENCIYSEDVISFARQKGWFTGVDKDFSFVGAYAPLSFGALRFCEARVWRIFDRAAPSLKLSIELVKGTDPTPLPLWVKPDQPVGLHDAMELMRDHYEGTEFDLTKGVGAGPYSLPYRWRPMTWKVDDVDYLNERAISTQQTGFSFVSQARSWLPDAIGGVFWFGVDDTASTVYVPMYSSIRKVPGNFAADTGSFNEFSWDSAFWVFNFVANYTYSRYSEMIVDVRKVQTELEGRFLGEQPAVEEAALSIFKESPERARQYLTEYSCRLGAETVARWRKLGEFLIWKYLDGNLRDEAGRVKHPGYPAEWYRRMGQDGGDILKVKKLPGEPQEH